MTMLIPYHSYQTQTPCNTEQVCAVCKRIYDNVEVCSDLPSLSLKFTAIKVFGSLTLESDRQCLGQRAIRRTLTCQTSLSAFQSPLSSPDEPSDSF